MNKVSSATAGLLPHRRVRLYSASSLPRHAPPSLEQSTIEGIELHFKHLLGALGEHFPIRELKLADLQGYVDIRAKAKGMYGTAAQPRNDQEGDRQPAHGLELGRKMGLVVGWFPLTGSFRDDREKSPFMTREEIERRCRRRPEAVPDQGTLERPVPDVARVRGLMVHVRECGTLPWVYPMVFAAHTGARRSELLRVEIADVDFTGKAVLIHEKKRARGKRTTRRVPLSAFLAGVLKEWLASHPGGPYLFCNAAVVGRSRKRSRTTGHKDMKTRATTLFGGWRT